MQSPSKEEVVNCLKKTPKGRLAYSSQSDTISNFGARSKRQVSVKDNRLVVTLHSPPDQRNSESLASFRDVEGCPKNYRLRNGNDEGKYGTISDGSTGKLVKTVQDGTVAYTHPSLHVSAHDVIDMLYCCRQELEKKARDESRVMKEKFLAGFSQIRDEAKRFEVEVNQNGHATFLKGASEIDQIIEKTSTVEDESLKTLKTQHKRRSLSVQSFNENIQKRLEKISKQIELQEEERKRKKFYSKEIERLLKTIQELYQKINENLAPHKSNDYLSSDIKQLSEIALRVFETAARGARNAIENQSALDETCTYLKKAALDMEMIKEKVLKEIENADVRKKVEESRKEVEEREKEVKIQEQKRLEQENFKARKQTQLSNIVLDACVSAEAFKGYKETVGFKESLKASYSSLMESGDKKTFRFDLTKAINTPINAISDQSPQHLMDKIERLTKLLNGEMTRVGNKNISCKDLPEGLPYCKDTIAKKLVLQGSRQVSSSFNSAFAFGAVAVGIWAQFPEVGKLMLAHFYTACPYLVPYYPTKAPDQSVAEYCRMLGYEVNGEDVEDENSFLKKLSGVVRLYAAIMQLPMPPKFQTAAHPHGLHNAWAWLSRVMNLEPRETVTATVLFDFLEVAGYALMRKYGKQFQKLLKMLYEDFLPKIDEVTAQDKKGPVVRLKTFIQKCAEAGSIPVPQGFLSSRWWKG